MDTLPTGVTFVRAVDDRSGTCALAAGVVTCTLDRLPYTFVWTVYIKVMPTAAGSLTNTIAAFNGIVNPDTANNSRTCKTTVTAPIVYTLGVAKAGVGSGTIASSVGAINCRTTCQGS